MFVSLHSSGCLKVKRKVNTSERLIFTGFVHRTEANTNNYGRDEKPYNFQLHPTGTPSGTADIVNIYYIHTSRGRLLSCIKMWWLCMQTLGEK